jgi:hypothetical protein
MEDGTWISPELYLPHAVETSTLEEEVIENARSYEGSDQDPSEGTGQDAEGASGSLLPT